MSMEGVGKKTSEGKMKIDRQAVYNKYHGHCAYCGKLITIKEMQVDHIVSKSQYRFLTRQERENFDIDQFSNLNPACRMCNHYKRASSLETFRRFYIGKLHERLAKLYIVRVALDYEIIKLNKWDKIFYFERIENERKKY